MARSKIAIAFTLVGTVLSSAAHALGLGAIEAKSHLNQPLEARIPLIASDADEVETLVVSLASPQAFERAGIPRPFSLTKLKFQVVKGERPFILVTSREPIKEPFLDFLIEASWGRGRLVREFTLLLDPPVYAQQPRPMVVTPPQSRTQASPAPAGGVSTAPAATPGSVGAGESLPPAVRDYGPVKANDTLWKIAARVRPDQSVSINQTMVALYQANPNAFIDGDMNRLKRGQVLRVPDRDTIARVSAAQANAEVRAQLARWQQSRNQAAEAGGAAEVAAARSEPEPQARLKVVAPSGSGGEQAATSLLDRDLAASPEVVRQLQNELRLSEESLASLKAENEELKQQLTALREQLVAQQERLININAESPVPAAGGAQPPVEQAVVAELTEPAAVEQTPVEQPAAEQPQAQAQVEQPPAAEQPAPPPVAEKKPKPRPAAKVEPPPPPPGFFDDVKNIGLVGGAVALLLALFYVFWRRRARRAEDEEPVEVEATSAVAEQPAAEQGQPQAEEEPLLQPVDDELTVAADGGDLLPESDALSEIDVYMAYGRYDQAQAVALKALEREPGRTELRLKLLEILALLHDRASFEREALALRDQVGTDDPAWERAVAMGRELAPDSALFGAAEEAAPAVEEPQASLDTPLDFGELTFEAPAAAAESAPQAAEEASGREAEPQAAADDDLSLDFNLDEPLEAAPEQRAEEAKPAEDELPSLDFDLSFEQPAEEPSDNVIEFTPAAAETAADSWEELDEVGTKLDLARAYLDMGDVEGARSLLDEVISEGNARQKNEAEALLKQIA